MLEWLQSSRAQIISTDTAIVTMEGEYETAPKLLTGISFNDNLYSPETGSEKKT